jgi:hypothetical protein
MYVADLNSLFYADLRRSKRLDDNFVQLHLSSAMY